MFCSTCVIRILKSNENVPGNKFTCMSENKYAMLACCKIFIYTDIHIWNEADLKNLYSQISERSKLLGSPQQNYGVFYFIFFKIIFYRNIFSVS